MNDAGRRMSGGEDAEEERGGVGGRRRTVTTGFYNAKSMHAIINRRGVTYMI